MDRNEIIRFLKEELEVHVEITTRAYCGPILVTRVILDEEEIHKSETSISMSDLKYEYRD